MATGFPERACFSKPFKDVTPLLNLKEFLLQSQSQTKCKNQITPSCFCCVTYFSSIIFSQFVHIYPFR